ncbi:MAG: hypothetical protein Q9178_003526 [Gyalolechia marmorata]
MHERPNRPDFIAAPLENADLIRHAGLSQFRDSHPEVNDSRKRYRREVMARCRDDKENLWGGRWVEGAVGEEIGVYYAVEAYTEIARLSSTAMKTGLKEEKGNRIVREAHLQEIINGVIDVVVHIIIGPAGTIVELVRIIISPARLEVFERHTSKSLRRSLPQGQSSSQTEVDSTEYVHQRVR